MEFYCYYELEYRRITYVHHTRQTRVYDEAFVARNERVRRVLEVLPVDSDMNIEEKRRLEQIFLNYARERDAYMNIPIRRSDGIPDVQEAIRQRKAMQNLDERMNQLWRYIG